MTGDLAGASGRPLEKLHITVLAFGSKYVRLFCTIVLPNLSSLIEEIPATLRAGTRLRILSDPEGAKIIRATPALSGVSEMVRVDLADDMIKGGFDRFGDYGPMILNQSRQVHEASREGAGIIFCPPDLVWSKGSFATIVDLAARGYRAIIGPSARGIEEEIVPVLSRRIEAHPKQKLAIASHELTRLLFDYWQQMNEGFIWNAPRSLYWKAYSYYRIDRSHYLMRFHQGPMMFAWPLHEVRGYMGWIDHRLINQCVRRDSQVFVIDDATRLQTVDLAPRDRKEGLTLVAAKKWYLWRQFLDRKHHCRYNLLYSRHVCRIYDQPLAETAWQHATYRFNRNVWPIIFLALAIRPIVGVLDGLWRHLGLARLYRVSRRVARALLNGLRSRWLGAVALAAKVRAKRSQLISEGGYTPRVVLSVAIGALGRRIASLWPVRVIYRGFAMVCALYEIKRREGMAAVVAKIVRGVVRRAQQFGTRLNRRGAHPRPNNPVEGPGP